jgi:TolA-binding protein
MRKKASYVAKYGADCGTKLYEALQKEAAHARVSASRLAKVNDLKDQVRDLKAEVLRLRRQVRRQGQP